LRAKSILNAKNYLIILEQDIVILE